MIQHSNRRATLRRTALWAGSIVLLIFAAIEIRARLGYSATLSQLRQVVGSAATERPLQLSEARSLFRGVPSQREHKHEQATVLELRWYSFIHDYVICLSTSENGNFTALYTGSFSEKLLLNTSPTASPSVAGRAAQSPNAEQVAREQVAARLARAKEDSEADRAFADVVVPDSHEFDPDALAVVQTMFRELPRRPLPAERNAATRNDTIGEGAWLRQQYVENYEKFGSRSADWDKAAISFLADGAAALVDDKLPADKAARVAEPGADLLRAGCDDALVCYVVGALYFRFNDEKGAVYRDQGFDKFRDSRYPLDCVLRVTLPHAQRQAWNRLVYSYRKRSADLDERGLYGANPIHPARRFLLLACLRSVPWDSYSKARDFLAAVYSVPQFDPWLRAMLTGRHFSALGSVIDLNSDDIRGSGREKRAWILPAKVNEVRYRHSWSAQACYLDAWRAHPDVPEAAYGILVEARRRRGLELDALNHEESIVLAAEEGVKSGWPEAGVHEATRFWFDQSVRAMFAFMPAYQQMLTALQEWSPESEYIDQILEFGRECVRTGRFDTPVPFVYLDALNILRNWMKDDKVYRLPGVYDDCCLLVEGYYRAAQTEQERNRLKSIGACLAIRSQKNDDARRILNELGDLVDCSVFEAQGIDLVASRKMLNDKHPNHRLLPGLDRPVFGIAFAGSDDSLLTAEGSLRTTTRWNLKDRIATGMFSHDDDVAALVAASGDGKLIATTGTAGGVRVWDAASGALLQTLAHDAHVRVVRFSPQGTRLATTAWDDSQSGGVVRVWDLATGEELARRTSAESIFHDLAFVAGEGTLAIAGGSYLGVSRGAPGEIIFWDLTTDQTTKTFRSLFERHSNGFALSADGKYLAALGQGIRNQGTGNEFFPTEIRILDLEQGDVVQTLIREPGGVTASTFIGQGEILATAGPDRAIRIWTVPECRLIAEFTGHRYRITALAAGPGASRLASLDAGGNVKIWELSGAATISQAQGELLEFPFRTVVRIWADPQGRFVATGDSTFGVIVWERANGWRASTVFPLHERLWMRDFDFSADGKFLAIAGEVPHVDSKRPAGENAGGIQLWDVAGRCLITQLDGHKKVVVCARFSPDSKVLATGGLDEQAILWNVENWRPFDWGVLKEHVGTVSSLSFSPDGKLLATGNEVFSSKAKDTGTVRFWGLPEDRLAPGIRLLAKQVAQTFTVPGVRYVEFSPDGKLLLAIDNRSAFVFDVATREKRVQADGNRGTFSSAGRNLILLNQELKGKAQLTLWEVGVNQPPTELQVPSSINWSAITPLADGRYYLAANGASSRVVVWDSVTNQLVDPFPDLKSAGDR